MLTAESEGGQLKCHPYWTGREFGPIKLRSMSEKKVSLDIDKSRSNSLVTPAPSSDSSTNSSQAELGRRRANTTTSAESNTPPPANASSQSSAAGETPFVIIRKFSLSHAAHPFSPIREVTQLHYASWPDFGAPAQPSHLLALVELANVMQRAALPVDVPSTIASVTETADEPGAGRQTVKKVLDTAPLSWHDSPETADNVRPMLVHCSAGCGRTGAFCTVDSVIDMLKRQRLAQISRSNPPQTPEKRKRNSVSGQGRAKDAEGDVNMTASSPVFTTLSPMDTSKQQDPSTFFRPTMTPPKTSANGATGAGSEDIDLKWLDDDTVDLVASTVEDFRRQRLSMVQSLRQFVLCYETVIEYLWRLQQQRGPTPGGGGSGRTRPRNGSLGR